MKVYELYEQSEKIQENMWDKFQNLDIGDAIIIILIILGFAMFFLLKYINREPPEYVG